MTDEFTIRGRNLGENIQNRGILEKVVEKLEELEGLSAGAEEYHREFDLLEHSLMVYDEMLQINDSDQALLMALTHDLGKIQTQEKDNDAKHDLYGKDIIEEMFTIVEKKENREDYEGMKLGCEQHIRLKNVAGWTEEHNPMRDKKVIGLVQEMKENDWVDIETLLDLCEADAKGRLPPQEFDREMAERRIDLAEQAIEIVDEHYSADKRESSRDEYSDEALQQMVQQDRVEMMKKNQ